MMRRKLSKLANEQNWRELTSLITSLRRENKIEKTLQPPDGDGKTCLWVQLKTFPCHIWPISYWTISYRPYDIVLTSTGPRTAKSKTFNWKKWSAYYGSLETTRFIVSLIKNFDFLKIIDAVGSKEFTTPLWIGAKQGHYEVVKLLHQNGSNINAKDIYGNTPLHMATKNCHHKVHSLSLPGRNDVKIIGNELFGERRSGLRMQK